MSYDRDMKDFMYREKRPDEWAEFRDVARQIRTSFVKNNAYWEDRRRRGAARVERYQRLYGNKKPF